MKNVLDNSEINLTFAIYILKDFCDWLSKFKLIKLKIKQFKEDLFEE